MNTEEGRSRRDRGQSHVDGTRFPNSHNQLLTACAKPVGVRRDHAGGGTALLVEYINGGAK